LLLTVAAAASLGGCVRQADVPSLTTIAPRAAEWALRIATGSSGFSAIRSSALLGVYLTDHLLREIVFRSAIAGVTAQMEFLSESSQEQEESFALLETLGSILQVDVPDMLNRSPVRSAAFDVYITNLQNLTKRAIDHVAGLEQEIDTLNDERRTQRADAARTQSTLNRAIRDGDYATASELQKDLIGLEGEVATLDAQLDEKRSIKNLMEDMIDVANDRMAVMAANRAAILAGITVVDLPGAEDLGVLEQGRRSRNNIFDPGTL
jgi:hypothetical protein